MRATTTNSKLNLAVIILTILVSLSFLTIACWRLFITPRDLTFKTPRYDEKLSPKICAYFASQTSFRQNKGQYDSYGNLISGPPAVYCEALIYGYNKDYIYALVTSNSYEWFYHYRNLRGDENTVRITRSVKRGAGWSSHIRLSYQSDTDFIITGYKQPRNGSLYYEDVLEMFAPMLAAANEPIVETPHQDLEEQFRSDHASDPYPDKIERIYSVRNPKIVIGGEV